VAGQRNRHLLLDGEVVAFDGDQTSFSYLQQRLGVTFIVVTHDLVLAARFADIVLVLSDGRLVSQGAPAEALSEQVMGDVFRISAFRAEYKREAVIVPWAEI